MKATKIRSEEIKDMKISSLPSRPTSETLYGGSGYSANDVKAAFDKLPLFIIERFNALLDDISAKPENSVSGVMQTGISNGHTLSQLFSDVKNGNMSAYLTVNGKSLATELYEIKEAIRALGGEI